MNDWNARKIEQKSNPFSGYCRLSLSPLLSLSLLILREYSKWCQRTNNLTELRCSCSCGGVAHRCISQQATPTWLHMRACRPSLRVGTNHAHLTAPSHAYLIVYAFMRACMLSLSRRGIGRSLFNFIFVSATLGPPSLPVAMAWRSHGSTNDQLVSNLKSEVGY